MRPPQPSGPASKTPRSSAGETIDRLGQPLAGPVAGRGAYQVMRPARGREKVTGLPRSRVARGSDGPPPPARQPAGGPPAEPLSVAPVRPAAVTREGDHTLEVAPRLWEPPRAGARLPRRRGSDWLLPMTVACVVSTGLVLLAALLR